MLVGVGNYASKEQRPFAIALDGVATFSRYGKTMDSLTQLTFGAACGEAVLGRKVGRKALVWGAVLGTIPDLDVFIPLGGPVNDFVYHRGFSHSLILLALLSPAVAWVISTVHSDTRRYYRKWFLLSFIVLESSVLLDLLTRDPDFLAF